MENKYIQPNTNRENNAYDARLLTIEINKVKKRLKGKPHPSAQDERDRKSVFKAIRMAKNRIINLHPGLGKYVTDYIKTGTSCRFIPPEDLTWET